MYPPRHSDFVRCRCLAHADSTRARPSNRESRSAAEAASIETKLEVGVICRCATFAVAGHGRSTAGPALHLHLLIVLVATLHIKRSKVLYMHAYTNCKNCSVNFFGMTMEICVCACFMRELIGSESEGLRYSKRARTWLSSPVHSQKQSLVQQLSRGAGAGASAGPAQLGSVGIKI